MKSQQDSQFFTVVYGRQSTIPYTCVTYKGQKLPQILNQIKRLKNSFFLLYITEKFCRTFFRIEMGLVMTHFIDTLIHMS